MHRYGTLAALAGVDTHDPRAEAAGLPAVDAVDVWPLVSGATSVSPRDVYVVGGNKGGTEDTLSGRNEKSGATIPMGLLRLPYKLVLGEEGPCNFRLALRNTDWLELHGHVCSGGKNEMARGEARLSAQQEHSVDDKSKFKCTALASMQCGHTPQTGCLFNVEEDPGESTRSASLPHPLCPVPHLGPAPPAIPLVSSPSQPRKEQAGALQRDARRGAEHVDVHALDRV